MIKLSINVAPSGWDNDLSECGDLLQTTYWANVLKNLDNAIPIFIEVYHNTSKIAKVLLFHCIPWDRKYNKFRKDRIGIILKNGFIRLYGAPCFFTDDKNLILKATIEIFQWVERYTKEKRILYIDIKGIYSRSFPDNDILSTYEKQNWATLIVNLESDESQIWSNIGSAARKSINKAKREGVYIQKIKTYDEYLNLYLKNYYTFNGKETLGVDIENDRVIWDLDDKDYYRYYIAKIDDVVIGMLGMYIFNGVATEIMSALSPMAFERKLPAQDLLHWEMFLEAKKIGCHSFDLAGINPDPKTAKELGIRRFKEKWNGEYIEYYNYSKITHTIPRNIYAIYKKIKNMRYNNE